MKYKIGKKSSVNANINRKTGRGVIVSRTYTKQGIAANPDCTYCGGDGYLQDTDSHKIDVQPCEACHPECYDKETERYNLLRQTKYPGATNEDIDRFERIKCD